MTDEPVSPHLDPHGLAPELASPMRLLARFNVAPMTLIQRHVCGDWGELDDTDRFENNLALIHDMRLFSSYLLRRPVGGEGNLHTEKLWIITEADRSVTTLLPPSEY